MPSEPFQVEFHIAGGDVVRFNMSEEQIRQHPHPAVHAMAMDEGRDGMRAAAAYWLQLVFSMKKATEPTSIIDDQGA